MPSYNEIDITSGGGVAINGLLPDPMPDTLQAALRGFIESLNSVRASYVRLLSDDRKLTGQERLELTCLLDQSMNFLVAVRYAIEKRPDFDAIVMKFNHHLRIRIQAPKWTGQGQMGRFRNLATKDFPLWLSRLQRERLPGLIKFLGQAMADGKLDDKERLLLNRSIDRSLFSILIVRESILSTMVD